MVVPECVFWPRTLLRIVRLLVFCGCFCGRFLSASSPSTDEGLGDDIHSAVFVVTQEGLNNAPQLYSQFLVDAIADANAEMRQPNYWCGIANGQQGCSGCVCNIKNQGVNVGVHLDMTTGRSPRGHPGDFFALAGDSSSIKLEILPPGNGYIGAVKMTTMISMGFNIPFEGSSLTGGGFFGICCSGFIWFHACSCESGCGCSHMCSVHNPGIEATAITELQVTILVHHDTVTGGLSASMDGCPGGNCLDAPHLADDLAIKCGCMGEILHRVQDSWMLQFLAWINGQGSVSSMAKKMLDEAKAMIVPKINEKLKEQLPMTAPQSCGTECGLPPGVDMSYTVPRAPEFVEAGHIEVQVDIDICTTALGGRRICFPPYDPFPPPGFAQPYRYPGTMLSGMRVSSSLMNGVSWAMGNSNLFVTVENITLLTAILAFNISWAEPSKPPVLKVPGDDLMEFEWSNGYVRVQCRSMPSAVDMLDFRWTELIGNGTFNHSLGGCNAFNADSCECAGKNTNGLSCKLRDKCSNFGTESDCSSAAPMGRCVWSQSSCMANTCAFPQVTWFDTSRSELKLISPQLPVPDRLLTEAMQSALQSGKGQLNGELQQNGMCLPSGIAKYLIPPPTVHMYTQHTIEHPDHGFLELVSFCGNSPNKPCLAHSTTPASGRGGTDCLPGNAPVVSKSCVDGLTDLSQHSCSPYSTTPGCKQLTEEVSLRCSPDEMLGAEHKASGQSSADTYTANGLVYSAGVYTTVVGKSCVASCKGHKNCNEQHFLNDVCSGFSKRTCVADVYVEKTYSSFNCTGEFTVRNVSSGVCITSTIPGTDNNVSMRVVCPRIIEHHLPEKQNHVAKWIVLALAGSALCICVGVLCQSARCRGVLSSSSETSRRCTRAVAGSMGHLYAQAAECWQPVWSSCSRCSGETRSSISLHCTTVTKWISQRAWNWWTRLCRAWVTTRGLSYSPRLYLGVHDWMHVLLMLSAAVGYASHLWFWHLNDPFAAFDRDIIGEIGLDDKWVDARPVQTHFTQWSQWGQSCQAWSAALIVTVTCIGLIDQVTPKHRNTMWMIAMAVVLIAQVGVMLVPSFLFEFKLSLFYNQNHSFTSDPETKSEADAALSLAFDGVALTFVSTLFVFMLHGIAPGVFMGSCVFCSHLMSLRHYQKRTPHARPPLIRGLNVPLRGLGPTPGSITRQSFSSFSSFTASDATMESARFTFALGSRRISNTWLARRPEALHISDQVLTQQGPRVRIINWLATLGAPCGGCLPVIIVYQSLGADTWWALMWVLCWVAPAALMIPLSKGLELDSRTRTGWVSALTSGTTALCYIALYGSITAAILMGLVGKAHAGGFEGFSVQYPITTFISTMLGTMALTVSYLESSILADATREHIGDVFGSVVLASSDAPQSRGATEEGAKDASASSPTVRSPMRECASSIWRWLIEADEQMDPHTYGRRLPTRRAQLIVGLCLSAWVLRETYRDSEGFKDHYVLSNVKELLVSLDTGLQWPEGNATVLDDAFDVYGECCKVEFLLQVLAVALLLCACWCDSTVREYHGLQASRVFGFVGLAVMFCSSLVPAGPNYLRISRMDTITPCCARKFNFAITTLLQDLVGIVCSGLFAFRLLPVLLIVVPSMVRACTLLLVDDILRCNQDVKAGSLEVIISNYADPAFSRSNVHSVLALCSMLTPLFTAIPMTVIFQFLRRYDQGALLTTMIMIFYGVPIILSWIRCDTIKRVELRYIAWMLGYFVPLFVMLLYEAHRFGFMEQVKARLLDPITYAEILAEMGLANVILSDIMYSNLYVERRPPDAAVRTPKSHCDAAVTLLEAAGGETGSARLPTLCETRPDSAVAVAASRPASPGTRPSSPALGSVGLDGYTQVLRDANATLDQSKSDNHLESIRGFGTLEALRRANRDDLVAAGLDVEQAAAVFAALGLFDARQSTGEVTEQATEPEPEHEPLPTDAEMEAKPSHADSHKTRRSCATKLVLLVLCPALLLACAAVASLQVLRYIDSFPWISRMLGLAQDFQPMGDLEPPPVASNGHPCPWEL